MRFFFFCFVIKISMKFGVTEFTSTHRHLNKNMAEKFTWPKYYWDACMYVCITLKERRHNSAADSKKKPRHNNYKTYHSLDRLHSLIKRRSIFFILLPLLNQNIDRIQFLVQKPIWTGSKSMTLNPVF